MTRFEGQGRAQVTDPSELLPLERYREFVFRALPRPEPIELRTFDALGLTSAEDITAGEALPSFANSAMDGYAVRAADVAGASHAVPVTVRVVGEVLAGGVAATPVHEGEALRIMTGAPLPPGADAVVPVEVTSGSGREVAIHRAPAVGQHVRPVGHDVAAGERLLVAGQRIKPADIGLLSAVGVHRVRCYPTPRVVVMTTGDELVAGEGDPGPGQIRDSNGPMLAALVRQAGAIPYTAGPVRDDRAVLVEAIESNLGHADMLLISGGISAGARDHVEDVVGQLGDVAKFKVAMQPGMPQIIGRIRGVPVFGIPGNPVSSFVSFEVFVRPALRVLQGRHDLLRPVVRARLATDVASPPHKVSFVRVVLSRDEGHWVATTTGGQGSHLLTSIARADGLAEIPADETSLPAGSTVRVHLLADA